MPALAIPVRKQRALDQRPGGTALTPAAAALIALGGAAFAAWLWSRAKQPEIDAATRARLQRQPARQEG